MKFVNGRIENEVNLLFLPKKTLPVKSTANPTQVKSSTLRLSPKIKSISHEFSFKRPTPSGYEGITQVGGNNRFSFKRPTPFGANRAESPFH